MPLLYVLKVTFIVAKYDKPSYKFDVKKTRSGFITVLG